MKKRLLILTSVLIIISMLFSGCNKHSEINSESDEYPQNEISTNIVYTNIEDGLVGETKILAQKIVEQAHSENFSLYTSLYTNDDSVIDIINDFCAALSQQKELLSVKIYTINRNGIGKNPSGGAMSRKEVLARYAAMYPAMINNQRGPATIAAAAILTMNTAYPQPTEFSGAQIIELRYSQEIAVCAVYSETENDTIQCTISPLIGEITEENSFVSVAASGYEGISFKCEEYDCDPSVSGSLFDCRMNIDCETLSQEAALNIAQSVMKLVGARANGSFLKMERCPESLIVFGLACQIYDYDPNGAIIWTVDDIEELYNFDVGLQLDTLFEARLVQGMGGYLCRSYGSTDMAASQSLMNVTTSFQIDGNVDPTIIWLIYEDGEDYCVGAVSFYSVSPGCVSVTASPLWEISIVDDSLAFYNGGKSITGYSEPLNTWLESGKYLSLQ